MLVTDPSVLGKANEAVVNREKEATFLTHIYPRSGHKPQPSIAFYHETARTGPAPSTPLTLTGQCNVL